MPGTSVLSVVEELRERIDRLAPGPDLAPYHDRQIVILERDAWADWLDPFVPAQTLIRPLSSGTLSVEQVG